MVDDEKHTTLGKWSKKDYMRDYMRERRKKARQQPAPLLTDLHGPVAPANLPRTESIKALLQAHYAHVLNLWAETGKELARVTETDEMVKTLESLMLENKHLQDEVKNLREALKTCQSKPQEPETQALKLEEPQLGTDLQPSKPLATDLPPTIQEPLDPGFVDPDRRPSPADDTPADWML